MKLVTEVLSDTVHNVSPPQARKNRFIWMGHLYGALSPGTTCWPGGGLKCSPGVGGSKMASRGVELLLTPPTPTYAPSSHGDFWHQSNEESTCIGKDLGSKMLLMRFDTLEKLLMNWE